MIAAPAPADILTNAASEIEARVQHLSDSLVHANENVRFHRDGLTSAVGRRDRLQHQLDGAQNTLRHVAMVLPSMAASIASHPITAVLVDTAASAAA